MLKEKGRDPKTGEAVKGKAVDRALAYLAHGGELSRQAGGGTTRQVNPLFGEAFGTLYDLSSFWRSSGLKESDYWPNAIGL